MQELVKQLVSEFNQGKPMSFLAKKYKLQHPVVKMLLLNSGSTLRRPAFLSESELIALANKYSIDEMAQYLFVEPLTLRKHLNKRKIKLPKTKTKDELYIEKQVTYLYLRERLSQYRIAQSLNIDINRVRKIVHTLEGMINRNPESTLMSIGESGGKFIEYHDLANVFPKQRQYARAF